MCICFWDRQCEDFRLSFFTDTTSADYTTGLILLLLLPSLTLNCSMRYRVVLLGLQTALQMLCTFLFQGHPFVVHQILHSVNNLGEIITWLFKTLFSISPDGITHTKPYRNKTFPFWRLPLIWEPPLFFFWTLELIWPRIAELSHFRQSQVDGKSHIDLNLRPVLGKWIQRRIYWYKCTSWCYITATNKFMFFYQRLKFHVIPLVFGYYNGLEYFKKHWMIKEISMRKIQID